VTRYVDLGSFTAGKRFRADLDIILRSNLLVQANSGGGKSWMLRRMIEQSFGRVPQIIVDPEGEFSTLRQKFDLVLVGKGGDTPADIRSAQLLAHRLLELGTSAVIDLFEMSKAQRPVWVAAFVQALVDAPKKLWRDLLLYVDEAHELAPEAGHGAHESSAEKQCRHALIDFAAKGRKRGYGVVAATQRLGKLSKDFAAELKNVLIGQTFIDIDRERAAGSLGISKANKTQFFVDVKTLSPGSFYALGRALTLEPTLVTIGEVQTEHPEAGRRQSAPPPPTEKIRHLLPQLADLPKEAETKIQTEKELRARIMELEHTVKFAAQAEATRLPVPAKTVERSVIKPADLTRVEKLIDRLQKGHGVLVETLMQERGKLQETEQKLVVAVGNLALQANQAKPVATDMPYAPGSVAGTTSRPRFVDPGRGPRQAVVRNEKRGNGSELSRCARALLAVLASRGVATDSQISALSGYRKTSSGFANSLSELRVLGLIDGPKERRTITDAGREAAGVVEAPPKGPALLDYWTPKLGRCEASLLQKIFEFGTISREDLSIATGYSTTSSGFANGISVLRVLDLVHGPQGGDLTIAGVFTE
jgi:hypothetical protein